MIRVEVPTEHARCFLVPFAVLPVCLTQAEMSGMTVPYDCRRGNCISCAARVQEGQGSNVLLIVLVESNYSSSSFYFSPRLLSHEYSLASVATKVGNNTRNQLSRCCVPPILAFLLLYTPSAFRIALYSCCPIATNVILSPIFMFHLALRLNNGKTKFSVQYFREFSNSAKRITNVYIYIYIHTYSVYLNRIERTYNVGHEALSRRFFHVVLSPTIQIPSRYSLRCNTHWRRHLLHGETGSSDRFENRADRRSDDGAPEVRYVFPPSTHCGTGARSARFCATRFVLVTHKMCFCDQSPLI